MSLDKAKHIAYIKSLDEQKQFIEYWLSEHLRMNGVYWGACALFMMKAEDEFNKADLVKFILNCYDETNGGFGSYPRHDAHLLSTLSALQLLKMYDCLDVIDDKRPQILKFITNLQLPDGSFQGDRFGEVDTRFVYTAIQSLSILESLTPEIVDPAVDFIIQCQNFDGGFGLVPGSESHSAQIFTCLATLAIAGQLDKIKDRDLLEWWLSDRQLENGGLNGRPEKLEDVCYSWWVMSSLSILDRLDYIDGEKLRAFILECQDLEQGGISDRPGNQVDVYHTNFGMAGLSLLGYEDLVPIDPVYCMPYVILHGLEPHSISSTSLVKRLPKIFGILNFGHSELDPLVTTDDHGSLSPGMNTSLHEAHSVGNCSKMEASESKYDLYTPEAVVCELYEIWVDVNGSDANEPLNIKATGSDAPVSSSLLNLVNSFFNPSTIFRFGRWISPPSTTILCSDNSFSNCSSFVRRDGSILPLLLYTELKSIFPSTSNEASLFSAGGWIIELT
ncbi:hypothetical protein OGAPHI_004838 [Ogataea philodendri]|uniref:Geranylgeranyl transferase type-2 subunit beta n=1 Tax=Ogataea philodendri TaxID=1378263 RepID=A0A9P8P3R6_9ASCO|nr:uncharacterized protein OGAPHI_004838 [Ogataea philodendri]KAH3664124.1 hypothetical protein OGAPHI_004838 [Ogataea philodendri]